MQQIPLSICSEKKNLFLSCFSIPMSKKRGQQSLKHARGVVVWCFLFEWGW